MNDNQLNRYSRQLLLSQVDITQQQTLLNATVLIVGVGGLGAPVALYLAGAGVGRLLLVDNDTVALSNLQRQIIYDDSQLEQSKVTAAQQRLQAMNPDVQVETFAERLNTANLPPLVQRATVVVDCSDNFPTRFALNAACVQQQKPLVSGAATGFQGQLSIFLNNILDSPCYRCLYDDNDVEETVNCTENGVLSPLVGVVGSLQALECLKILLSIGDTLCGKLLLYNGLTSQWKMLKLRRDPACLVCNTRT